MKIKKFYCVKIPSLAAFGISDISAEIAAHKAICSGMCTSRSECCKVACEAAELYIVVQPEISPVPIHSPLEAPIFADNGGLLHSSQAIAVSHVPLREIKSLVPEDSFAWEEFYDLQNALAEEDFATSNPLD